MTAAWLLDNSAWARLDLTALTDDRRQEIAERFDAGRIHTSLPFFLEAGVSARNAVDWDEILRDLVMLPDAPIDAVVERRAREAQLDLIEVGIHRAIPVVDLVLAALAERHGLTLLHYDGDFDRLRERTRLRFDAEWLAPPGAL